MPHLSTLSLLIWTAGAAGQAGLLLWMGVQKDCMRWPALVSLLWILTLRNAFEAGSILLHSPYVCFWSYWWLSAAAEACEVLLIVEVFLKVAGLSRSLRRIISLIFPAACFVGAALAVMYVYVEYPTMPMYSRVSYVVTLLYQGIALSWLLSVLAGTVLADVFGFPMSGTVRWVAAGFMVEVTAAGAESWLYAHHLDVSWLHLSEAKGALFCVSLVLWSRAMRPHCTTTEECEPLPLLNRALAAFRMQGTVRAH